MWKSKKKVYLCQVCNAYMTKDINEPAPICCGTVTVLMDEPFNEEVCEGNDVSGGL